MNASFRSRSLSQAQRRRRSFRLRVPRFPAGRLPMRGDGKARSFLRHLFLFFSGAGHWKRGVVRSGIFLAVIGTLYLSVLWFTLPDIADPRSLIASQSTVITDRNGIELYRLFNEEDRTFIEREQIPSHLKHAVISIEDQRFYDRGCLDLRAIARAVFLLGRAGGGSTITRQLARNALNLHRDNRYQRKIKELILGCQLESQFEKEELLDLYLNWIPFGSNAYGAEQAAKHYFATTASGLTLAQSAVLASLPQRPSYFSPYGNHVTTTVSEAVEQRISAAEITKHSQIDDRDMTIGLLGAEVGSGATTVYVGGRTDQVLLNMERQGFISEAERLAALNELSEITFQPSREDIRAAHFVLWVREQVEEMFSGTSEEGLLEQGGLQIQTTLDWTLQEAAEETVAFHRDDLIERYGGRNMALVSLDPHTREVLAYVGNTDYHDTEHGGKIDMVRAPRQPGSSFKPFVYASAFARGYSPATPIYDVPTEIGSDEPQNFDGLFTGLHTMRTALARSRNIPAAKAFFLGGGENTIVSLVSELGASTPLTRKQELKVERGEEFDYGWPLALGAAETPLLEMAHAYSSLADGGLYKPVVSIRRITDKKGNLLFESEESKGEKVLDERIAYLVTSVLSDKAARPNEEYWREQLSVPGYQTAAKTGTSNKCLEWREWKEGSIERKTCVLRKPDNAWLLGYTPNLVTGVWVGNADSSAMYDRAGGLNTASPIWRDYMMRAHRKLTGKKDTFAVPDGIVQLQISALSGQLPTACTPVAYRRTDVFLKENIPTQPDPACLELEVDRVTGLLASDSCPRDALASGSFLAVHSLLPDRWPKWEEGLQGWFTEQMELWNSDPTHSGAIIPLPRAPTEECDPSLTPGRLLKPDLTISYPKENGEAGYPSFTPVLQYKGADIAEVEYRIDSKLARTVSSPPFQPPLRVPRSIAEGGMHTLQVTVKDIYFNAVTDRVRFRFGRDASGPSVRLLQPTDGTTVSRGDSVTIRAEASDPGGIKYVQFYLDDLLLTTKPAEPYTLSYPMDLKPGEYALRARAIDLNSNSAEDVVTVVVEE